MTLIWVDGEPLEPAKHEKPEHPKREDDELVIPSPPGESCGEW